MTETAGHRLADLECFLLEVCALRQGAPVVALETMAAGVPLVASDTGALRDVTDGAARLTAPGDVHTLASALSAALRESNATRVEKGLAIAEAHDWSQVGPRLLGGSQQVMSSAPRMT